MDVAQDFAWDRAGLPNQGGISFVHLKTGPPPAASSDALWAIAAPFTATRPSLQINTVLLDNTAATVAGRNQLVFKARLGAPNYAYRLDIRLTKSDAPPFATLKRASLDSDVVLRTQADRMPPSQ